MKPPDNDEKMFVPIPVLLAHPTPNTPGDAIAWSPGQRAIFRSGYGKTYDVMVITGKFVGHAAVPGDLCLEVTFEDGSGDGCVLARALRLQP